MITLTEEQQLVCDQIVESLKAGKSCCLIGRAGTGKSTTLKEILPHFNEEDTVCSAPTHQACNVFRDITGRRCCTLASLLLKKKEIDYDTGEILFNPGDWIDYTQRLVIIDESSMLGVTDKNTLMRNFPKCTFLFCGDSGQLPSIDDEDFCIFDHFPCYELTTNMRCGQGNVLFENIENIYNNPEVQLSKLIVDGNVKRIKMDDLTPEDLIIVYYNKTRIKHNQFILNKYFGGIITPEVKFIANDNLRYNKKKGTYVATNGETFFPERVMPYTYDLNYSAKIESKRVQGYIITFRGTDLNYLPDRTVLNSYLEYFKSHKDWRSYYRISEYFDNIDLAFSVSSHKSQGTTYKHITVDVNDIASAPPKVKKASLYVAMSRASESCNLISVR